jgi:hypothetical protein
VWLKNLIVSIDQRMELWNLGKRCEIWEIWGSVDGQCGRRVAAPAAVALALSVVSLYLLDIEGSGSRTLLCL